MNSSNTSRKGELAIDTDEGDRAAGQDAQKALLRDWHLDLSAGQCRGPRDGHATARAVKLVHNIVLSMPSPTPADRYWRQRGSSRARSSHSSTGTRWCYTPTSGTRTSISSSKPRARRAGDYTLTRRCWRWISAEYRAPSVQPAPLDGSARRRTSGTHAFRSRSSAACSDSARRRPHTQCTPSPNTLPHARGCTISRDVADRGRPPGRLRGLPPFRNLRKGVCHWRNQSERRVFESGSVILRDSSIGPGLNKTASACAPDPPIAAFYRK